jgi:hypothetical protein
MQIQLKSPVLFDRKRYAPGLIEVPDHLAHDSYFKMLVKDGVIEVMPKNDAQIAIQAQKDNAAQVAAAQLAKSSKAPEAPMAKPIKVKASKK